MDKFEFLKATRFWVSVIGAISIYLQSKGVIGEPEMVLVATISTLFVTVRTIDRFAEQSNMQK